MFALATWADASLAQASTPADRAELLERVQDEVFLESIRDCKTGMPRCWYLLFGAGEAPFRKLWFVDLNVRDSGKDGVELDVIEADESDRPGDSVANDFVLMTLQFRCREKKFRIRDGYALMLDGGVDRAPGATPWFPVPKAWHERAARVACEREVRLRPLAYEMAWVGDYFRPVDVVDIARRFLWSRADAAP